VTPGLVLVQHSGGGKANQYFLRGFDVDHGTDLALSIDGILINLVSHAHGQGYADTNFIIPEVVERVQICRATTFHRARWAPVSSAHPDTAAPATAPW
jgi:outer membrane cobalamin receptor